MAHAHSLYDTDPHFRIDPVTRNIINMSGKVVLVQHDHNSERFTFEIPRYVDGHDMSLCNQVEVHYTNGNSTSKNHGMYPVDDFQIDPNDDNYVICSWLISHNATKLIGTLGFMIRFECLTNEVIDYAWSTSTFSGITVNPGIYHTDEIANEYVDILEQWRLDFEKDGVTITGVEQTITSTEDEGLNEITITFSDETTGTFYVRNGSRGSKGDPFVYSDFTAEQLAALKGEKGDTFTYDDLTPEQIASFKGDKGDAFTYSDFTADQLAALKGEKGDAFTYADFTAEQLQYLTGPTGASIDTIVRTHGTGAPGTIDTYTITLTDGRTHTFRVYNGADGTGDMMSTVYDPQDKATDIFAYTDVVQNNLNDHAADTDTHVTLDEKSKWDGKQDVLTFDDAPTANSTNPVTSSGVYEALSDVRKEVDGKSDEGHVHDQYVTKDELDDKNYLTSIPDEYITEDELTAKGYVTNTDIDNAISNKADASVVEALQKEVDSKADLEHSHDQYLTSVPDEYITEDDLAAKGYLTDVPDEYITEDELSNKGYLTDSDIENAISNKADVSALTELQKEVDNKAEIEHTHDISDVTGLQEALDIIAPGGNVSDGILKLATEYTDSEISKLINGAPTTLDTLGEISEAMKENSDIVDLLDQAVGSKANTSDLETLRKEVDNKADTEHTHKQYLTEIPSEYVTDDELTAKGYLTAVPSEYVTENELSSKNYATISALDELQKEVDGKSEEGHTHNQYLTEIPSEYITESELNAKGYLTAVPDEYVTEDELTAKNYATNDSLNELQKEVDGKSNDGHIHEQYLTEIPSEYITENELAAKNYTTVSDLSELQTQIYDKQDTLSFDTTPTANSNNPVTSGGIYAALQSMNDTLGDIGSLLDSINGEVI